MSIPVLIEVYDETRRLAIAGSAVASGDFRLKKLIPSLQKSGEKAPVFAKVAQSVQAVVDSNEKTASLALLELTTLVNAILYTQGETGIAGELKPLQCSNLGRQATQVSARILKPLLEALNSTGSGRLELIRDAFDRGAFRDLRLVRPALNAIDDPYGEIAEFIREKVLPLYGKAIVGELRATLNIKGRGGHLHRLQLLHQLDPEGSRDLIQLALNEGSKEMKVVAIECLGKSESDLGYLMEQVRSKANDVRAAALRALSIIGVKTADVLSTLKKAIAGADLELIIGRVKETKLPEIQDYVLEQAEQQFDELLKAKDKKAQGPAIDRLQKLVICVEDRTDPRAEAFLLRCFDNAAMVAAIKSDPSGADLNELVASVLAQGTPAMQKRLVAAQKKLTAGMIPPAMFAARAIMDPGDFYTELSPLLKSISGKDVKKKPEDSARALALVGVLCANGAEHPSIHRSWTRLAGHRSRRDQTLLPALDSRWLDAAIAAGELRLVLELARPGHSETNKFLSEQLTSIASPHEEQQILQTMIRIGHPGATDTLIGVLKKQAKETHYSYFNYWYGRLIAELPKSALPKLEELLPVLPEKMLDQLIDSIVALKNKPE